MRYQRKLTYPEPFHLLSGRQTHGATATAESLTGTVAIHASPSSHAPVVGRAPCGAPLLVIGRQAGWHAVRYDNCQGFVSGEEIVLNY